MNVKPEPLSDNEDSKEIQAVRRTKRPKKRIDWGFLKFPRKKRNDLGEGTDKEGILIQPRQKIIASKHEVEKETLPAAHYLPGKGDENQITDLVSTTSYLPLEGCYVTRMEKLETAPSSEATMSAGSDSDFTDQEDHEILADHCYAASSPKKKRMLLEPKKETVETEKARKPTVDLATLAAYRSLIDHTYSSITPSSIIDAVMLKHTYICTIQNMEYQEECTVKAGYIQDQSHCEAMNEPVSDSWRTSQVLFDQSANPFKKKGGKSKKVKLPSKCCDVSENPPPQCEPAGSLAENPKFRRKNRSPKSFSRIKVEKRGRSPLSSRSSSRIKLEKRETSAVYPKVPAKKLSKSPTKKRIITKKEKLVKKEEVDETFDSSSLSSKPEPEEETKKLKRRRRRNQTGWPTKYKSQPNKSKTSAQKTVAKNPKYRLHEEDAKVEKARELRLDERVKNDIKIEKNDEISSFAEGYVSIEEAVKRRRQTQKESKKQIVPVSPAKKVREKRKVKSVYQKSEVESSQLNEDEEGTPKRVGRKSKVIMKSSLTSCIKQEPQSSDDEATETDGNSDNISSTGSLSVSRKSKRKISIPARFRVLEGSSTNPTTTRTKETKNEEENCSPVSVRNEGSVDEDTECTQSATESLPECPPSKSPTGPAEASPEKSNDLGEVLTNANDTITPHIPESLEKTEGKAVSSQVENTSDSPAFVVPKSCVSTPTNELAKDGASTSYHHSSAYSPPTLPSHDLKTETDRVDEPAASSGDLINQEHATENLVPNPKVRMSLRKRVKLQVTSLFKSRKTSKSKTAATQPTKLVKIKDEIFDDYGLSGSSLKSPTDSRGDSTLQSPSVSTKSKRRRKKHFWGHHRKLRSKEIPKVTMSPVKIESKKKGDRSLGNFPDHKKDEIIENGFEVDDELRRAELGLAIVKVETMESNFVHEESREQEGNHVFVQTDQDSGRSEILKDSRDNCAVSQETDSDLKGLTCTEKLDTDDSDVSIDLVDKGGTCEGMMEPEVVYPPLENLDYTGWTNTKTIYTTDVSSDSELDDECTISVGGDAASNCDDSRSYLQSPSSESEAVPDADVHKSGVTDVLNCRLENNECHPGIKNTKLVDSDHNKFAALAGHGGSRTSNDQEDGEDPLRDIVCPSDRSKVAVLVESDVLNLAEPTFKDVLISIPEQEGHSNHYSGIREIPKDSKVHCAVSQGIGSKSEELTCTMKFDSSSLVFGRSSTKCPPKENIGVLVELDQSTSVGSTFEECVKPPSNPHKNPLLTKVSKPVDSGLSSFTCSEKFDSLNSLFGSGSTKCPPKEKVSVLKEPDPSTVTKSTCDDGSDSTIKVEGEEAPDHAMPAKLTHDKESDETSSKPEREDDPLSSRVECTVGDSFDDQIISLSTGKEAEDPECYQSTHAKSTSGKRRSSNYSEDDPLLSKIKRDPGSQFTESAHLPEIKAATLLVESGHRESAELTFEDNRSFFYGIESPSSDEHDSNFSSKVQEKEEGGRVVCSFGCCSSKRICPPRRKGAVCTEPNQSKPETLTYNDDRSFNYGRNSSLSDSEEEEDSKVMPDIGGRLRNRTSPPRTKAWEEHSSSKPEESLSSRVLCAMGCCSSNKICPPEKGAAVLEPDQSELTSESNRSSSSDEGVELEDDPTSTMMLDHQVDWEEWIKHRRGKMRKLRLRQRIHKLRRLRAKRKYIKKAPKHAFAGLRRYSTLDKRNKVDSYEKEPHPKRPSDGSSVSLPEDEDYYGRKEDHEIEDDPLNCGGKEYDPLCDWPESHRVTADVTGTEGVEQKLEFRSLEGVIKTADISLRSESCRNVVVTKTASVCQNRRGEEINRFSESIPSIIRLLKPINKVPTAQNKKGDALSPLLTKPVNLEDSDRVMLERSGVISSTFEPSQSCTIGLYTRVLDDEESLRANTDLKGNEGIADLPPMLQNVPKRDITQILGVDETVPSHPIHSNPLNLVPKTVRHPASGTTLGNLRKMETVGIRTITSREKARKEFEQINIEHAYCRKDLGYNNYACNDSYVCVGDNGIFERHNRFVESERANIRSKKVTKKFPLMIKPKVVNDKMHTPDVVFNTYKPKVPDSHDLYGIATLHPEPTPKAVTVASIKAAYKGGVYSAPENNKAVRIQEEGLPYTPPPEVVRLDVLVRKRFKMPTGEVSYFLKKDGRPPFSYQTIACMAIESDPLKSARASDVFDFMTKHLSFYREITSKWWKHNIRTMLSTSKIFRSDRIGSSTYYSFCKELRLPGDPAIYEMTEEPPTDVSDQSEEEECDQQETSEHDANDQQDEPPYDNAFGDLFTPMADLEESYEEVDPLIPICSYSDDESDGFPVIVNAETFTGGELPPHTIPEDDQFECDTEIKEEPDEAIFVEEPSVNMEATPHSATGVRLYCCPYCPAVFDTLQDNLDHKVIHPEVMKPCPKCDFSSADDVQLLWHINGAHS